jgi:hypothetical protein
MRSFCGRWAYPKKIRPFDDEAPARVHIFLQINCYSLAYAYDDPNEALNHMRIRILSLFFNDGCLEYLNDDCDRVISLDHIKKIYSVKGGIVFEI